MCEQATAPKTTDALGFSAGQRVRILPNDIVDPRAVGQIGVVTGNVIAGFAVVVGELDGVGSAISGAGTQGVLPEDLEPVE